MDQAVGAGQGNTKNTVAFAGQRSKKKWIKKHPLPVERFQPQPLTQFPPFSC